MMIQGCRAMIYILLVVIFSIITLLPLSHGAKMLMPSWYLLLIVLSQWQAMNKLWALAMACLLGFWQDMLLGMPLGYTVLIHMGVMLFLLSAPEGSSTGNLDGYEWLVAILAGFIFHLTQWVMAWLILDYAGSPWWMLAGWLSTSALMTLAFILAQNLYRYYPSLMGANNRYTAS